METPGSFDQLTNCLKPVDLLNGMCSNGGSGIYSQTREHCSSKRQRRRAQNFTDNDLQTLLNEMQPRRDRLLGVHGRKPQKPISRAMWREVAMALNATSLTSRTADQCRKKFNDLTRAGKEKLMHNALERQECRGGIPNIKELTPYEEQAVQLLGRQCGLAVVADGEIGVTVQTPEPSQQWGLEDDDDDDDDDEEEEKLCFLVNYDDEEVDDENKPDRESLQLDAAPISTVPIPSISPPASLAFSLPQSSSDMVTRARLDGVSEEVARGDSQGVRESDEWGMGEDIPLPQRRPRRRMPRNSEPWESDFMGTRPKRRMFNEHHTYVHALRSVFEDVQHLTAVTLESTALICNSIKEAFTSLQSSMEHVAASLESAARPHFRSAQEPVHAPTPSDVQNAALAVIGERIDSTLRVGFQTLGAGIQAAVSHGFQDLIAAIKPTIPLVNGNANKGPSAMPMFEGNLPGTAGSQDSHMWQTSDLSSHSIKSAEFRKQYQTAHTETHKIQPVATPCQEQAALGGGPPQSHEPFAAQELPMPSCDTQVAPRRNSRIGDRKARLTTPGKPCMKRK
ncbi:uncharacterized protein LOC122563765 [Chiloscyllium plagiosum]|uniref:uncharacterized protein LOC122563765 n=1 Tax=Chiloscyllium plagiosum TaxID=36176 RepID=UPI001CB7BB92|nr:uncharacterized protein LOC122563765 [Chiloscyllium plagiosum]XP_043573906.1 uncharacterized protein LOC122563765 [Chiloscyllium plagiosum]